MRYHPLSATTGTVLEAWRFINVHFPARQHAPLSPERWEVWLDVQGEPQQFIVHSAAWPARVGHRVAVLAMGDWVVGLFNATTGFAVNYVRQNPPGLLRWRDLAATVGLAAATAVAMGNVSWAGVLAALSMVYVPAMGWVRGRRCRRLQRRVDAALEELADDDAPTTATHAGRLRCIEGGRGRLEREALRYLLDGDARLDDVLHRLVRPDRARPPPRSN